MFDILPVEILGRNHKKYMLYMLLETDASPPRKWRDRSRAKWNTVSTLRWWTVAADGSASFKEIDGQIEKRRKPCFYFEMINCCRWSTCVLSAIWWTDQKPKQKLFLLGDVDLLLQTEVSPSKKLMDRWRTEGDPVSTLRIWSVAADGSPSFKDI